MARHEAAAGVDFHLPDEILVVIPTDPYEQLDVAHKITSMAIASRVSRLEADVARLRRDLADRDRVEADLRARLADSDARLLAALDENAKLVKERDTLAVTTKKMEGTLHTLAVCTTATKNSFIQLSFYKGRPSRNLQLGLQQEGRSATKECECMLNYTDQKI